MHLRRCAAIAFLSYLITVGIGAGNGVSPASTEPAYVAKVARGELEDYFTEMNLRFDCKTFEYRDMTLTAKDVALYPDSGSDRVAAKHGERQDPKVTIQNLRVVLATRPAQGEGLKPKRIEIGNMVVPRPTAIRTSTQPTAWDFHGPLLLMRMADHVANAEWTPLFEITFKNQDARDKSPEALARALGFDNLTSLDINGFMMEFALEVEGQQPRLIALKLREVQRGNDGVWRGRFTFGGRTGVDTEVKWDEETVRLEFKVENGSLMARSPDAPPEEAATQKETPPVQKVKTIEHADGSVERINETVPASRSQ